MPMSSLMRNEMNLLAARLAWVGVCVTEPGQTTGSAVFLQSLNPPVNKPILMHHLILALGWPRLKWVVTDSKYLSKSPKDWQPNISAAGTEPAYIEVSREWGIGSSFHELN